MFVCSPTGVKFVMFQRPEERERWQFLTLNLECIHAGHTCIISWLSQREKDLGHQNREKWQAGTMYEALETMKAMATRAVMLHERVNSKAGGLSNTERSMMLWEGIWVQWMLGYTKKEDRNNVHAKDPLVRALIISSNPDRGLHREMRFSGSVRSISITGHSWP